LWVLAAILGAVWADADIVDQRPRWLDALDALRGRQLSPQQHQDLYRDAVRGETYPDFDPEDIPPARFDCEDFPQPGFYADLDMACQVFRRCDVNGGMFTYMCPTQTLFNQVTLSCDWWYNVDCQRSADFYDYSNSRLYQQRAPFLDNQGDHEEGSEEDHHPAAIPVRHHHKSSH